MKTSLGLLACSTLLATSVVANAAPNLVKISSDGFESMFLMADGTVKISGIDYGLGNLCQGSLASVTVATPVDVGLTDIVDIHAGNATSFFVKKDGSLWYCGLHPVTRGRIPTPTPLPEAIGHMVQHVVSANQTVFFSTKPNGLYQVGYGAPTVTQALSQRIDQLEAGDGHIIALSGGYMFGYGDSTYGQLGVSGTLATFTQLNPGGRLTAAAKVVADGYGTIYKDAVAGGWFAMGRNNYGMFGPSARDYNFTPVSLGSDFVDMALSGSQTLTGVKADGTVWGIGWHNYIGAGAYNLGTTWFKFPNWPVQSASTPVAMFNSRSPTLTCLPSAAPMASKA